VSWGCVMDSLFLTPEQVAELLATSVTWVYEKSRTRQRDPLPTLRIGRYIRFEKDAVIQWARNRGNSAAKKISKEKSQ
jgi:excisionase family DNA binding protein